MRDMKQIKVDKYTTHCSKCGSGSLPVIFAISLSKSSGLAASLILMKKMIVTIIATISVANIILCSVFNPSHQN